VVGGLELVEDALRGHLLGHGRTEHGVDAERVHDAVDLVDAVQHLLRLVGGQIGVAEDHFSRGDVVVLGQLVIGGQKLQLVGIDVLFVLGGQDMREIVVGLHVVVAVDRGHQQDDERDEEHEVVLGDEPGQPAHLGQQALVLQLREGLVENQQEGRQDRDGADDAQQDALGHDDAEIYAHRVAHEAQGDEARDRGDGAAGHRGDRRGDGVGHGVRVVGLQRFLLLVAVPEEDGVVHRDGQLQHRGQRLGDVGDLAHDRVRAHVVDDRDADADEEDEGRQPVVERQHHGGQSAADGDRDVDGLFLFADGLEVRDEGGQTGDVSLLAGQAADLANGLHGFVGGGRGVEEHGQQRRVAAVEFLVDAVGQRLLGDAQIQIGVVPQNGVHMVDALNLGLELGDIPVVHALDHDEGKRAFSEFIHQDILALDRFHGAGQVIEHVVIDPGLCHAQNRGQQERKGQDQNRPPPFCNGFPKFQQDFIPP